MEHPQYEYGQREARPDPEPSRHVAQLMVLFRRGPDRFQLERHAANRTAPRMILLDLWKHRAGPDCSRIGGGDRGVALQRHAAFWAVARCFAHDALTHRTIIFRAARRLHCAAM